MKALIHPSTAGRRRTGIVIMEVIVALAIFGLAASGLIGALISSVKSATASQLELRMLLRLQSTLNEYSKYPRIQEYENQTFETDPDELGIWTKAEVVKLEDITNSEGQPLEEMYEIIVTAYYDNFGQVGEVKANTVRYAKLYGTTGTATGGAPQPTPR